MFQNALVSYGLGLMTAVTMAGTQAFAAEPDPFAERPQITVAQLVESVLARHPGLKARQAALEAAEYRIAPAGALDDPALSYSTAPDTLDGPRGLNQRLELSQPLPWPGKLALRKQAAQETARAVSEDEKNLRLQVAAAAKTLFAEWFYVHRALAINRDHQTLLEELRRIAEIQYAAGRAGQQDALQAEVARARLETEAVTLERRRREVQARINALLNRPPQTPVPLPAGFPELSPLPRLEQLQITALRAHPELARIRARIAGAKAQAGLAEKDFYPDFRLMAGYNSFWDEPDKRWTLGFSINLPFDYGHKRSAALDAARANLRQARWRLTDREAQLLSELEASRAAVEETEAVIKVYLRRLAPLAQDNLDAARADYRAGAGPFINVIDAERQQLRTEEGLARARADYLRQLAELERWIGAPFDQLSDPLSAPAVHSQPSKELTP
ncbi:outer membrane efflux protein [Nitrosococcus halophilus Nc 4]|uniref:Outer membrane efflux protein n=1 Tax=Nitrosococcus halophilus (strain Nc4) TaxID=472759 RepID=D5C2E3_NITHN|nr:TolC family protein [Nitrosococcus halophilus]ADE14802.1 outer membrane efflux protein [Nitrosococcus halophilus Nc 4]